MADALSITASIMGIVGPALHAIRLLLGDLQQLKEELVVLSVSPGA